MPADFRAGDQIVTVKKIDGIPVGTRGVVVKKRRFLEVDVAFDDLGVRKHIANGRLAAVRSAMR